MIAPISEYFFKGPDIPEGARFRIRVPHIIKDIFNTRRKIKVKHWHNNILSDARPLTRIQDPAEIYFTYNTNNVEIFSRNFCKFIITAEGINCCSSSAAMITFSKMEPGPLANIAIYFASPHYLYTEEYRRVSLLVWMISISLQFNHK